MQEIINKIKNTSQNTCISGIKIDFEAENFSNQQALYLADFCKENNLSFIAKIGGCEAFKDLCDAHSLGVKSIVAPMIESKYALSKFINTSKMVFSEDTDFFINIETKTACDNIDEILNNEEAKYLKGIVIGRSDLSQSFGLDKSEVNNIVISKTSLDIAKKVKDKGLICTIGGNLCEKSLDFIATYSEFFDFFETRKVIFNTSKTLKENPIVHINLAIEFEIKWLEEVAKSTKYPVCWAVQRIEQLKDRQKICS